MGEFVGGLREGGRRGLGGSGAAGQRVGAMADRGQRRRGRLGAPATELARVPSWRSCRKFEFQQFKDFLAEIASALAVSVRATAAAGTAPGFVGSTAGAVASGTRFRNNRRP